MLTKSRLSLNIFLILFIECLVYFWAFWTTKTDFIFDKCARNSGRASSAIILSVLLMIGFYGLKKIFNDVKKRETFQSLMILFTINHLIHFFFVFNNFKSHSLNLKIAENLHGFITFLSIITIPLLLMGFKKLNLFIYTLIILYLFNTSYFIMKTFYSKITLEHPAYHNQFGILIISLSLGYILYRILREIYQNFTKTSIEI